MMQRNSIDRLSGGTLFSLIVQAMRQRTNSQETQIGKIEGVTEETCMKTLLGIMYEPYRSFNGNSLKTNLNLYKKCEISSGAGIPMEDDVLINSFRDGMRNRYFEMLKAMDDFVSKYIEPGKKEWLIYAVLELIYVDDNINPDTELFLITSGKKIVKKDIPANFDYSVASVMLGSWFYIVDNSIPNDSGKGTFERWHKTEKYKKPEFISGIGKDNILGIKLASKKQSIQIEVIPGNSDKSYLLRYAEYISGVKGKYSTSKSYLYRSEPRAFYDFYVCNDVQESVDVAGKNGSWYKPNVIKSVTIEDLLKRQSFLMLCGTAGIGKSMMMQHLMNDAINKYENTGLIPIFVPLKKYDASYRSIEAYVFSHFGVFDETLMEDDLRALLSKGHCLVLFDGLDEIGSSDEKQFELAAESFVDKYNKNVFVVSSRPYTAGASFDRFTTINILPFTKEQAIQLVDKLQFGDENEDLRKSFKDRLKKGMYLTHKSSIANPLLLTLMMMTYDENADVPTKRYLFYSKAFHALAEKHDAKKSAFNRSLSTGLSVDRLKEYLAEFSAKTYRDGEKEFDAEKIERYFSRLKRRKEDIDKNMELNVSDFIDDLTTKVCIMYEENGVYRFIHDSFQDYFCALYFSSQKDKMLRQIGEIFEHNMKNAYDDQAFAMLYDMIPHHIEEYIFFPILSDLFPNGEVSTKGYWKFLKILYPTITYATGEVPERVENNPSSFIYRFIVNLKGLHTEIGNEGMPYHEGHIMKRYYYVISEDGELRLTALDTMSPEEAEGYNISKPDGMLIKVSIEDLLLNPEVFRDIIDFFESSDFALRREYESVYSFMKSINIEDACKEKDLFDYLD